MLLMSATQKEHCTKKKSFPLSISSVNMTKSAGKLCSGSIFLIRLRFGLSHLRKHKTLLKDTFVLFFHIIS